MTRLALARTRVSGTVTLQGTLFTFTASSSGTASAVKVREAKKLAVIASNTAARTAARVSIEKILSENSAVLSDLEITEAITNNLSTTVRIFKPLALALIASSTDGINFTLNKKTTIPADRVLTIPRGKTLTIGHELTNYGLFEIGDSTSSESNTSNKDTTNPPPTVTYSSSCSNYGTINVKSGESYQINPGVKIKNYETFEISGTVTNNGMFYNINKDTYFGVLLIRSGGSFNIFSSNGETLTNEGYITNFGTITNEGKEVLSTISNSESVKNYGTIANGSLGTFVSKKFATYENYGSCTGSCPTPSK